MYDSYPELHIEVKSGDRQVADSPYVMQGKWAVSVICRPTYSGGANANIKFLGGKKGGARSFYG